jgi:hypothetical protein
MLMVYEVLTGHHVSGRELGSYALEEYTSVKVCIIIKIVYITCTLTLVYQAVHWNFGDKLDWPL